MKKLFLLSLTIFMLSCGTSFKLYSKSEKKQLVEQIFKNENNAKTEYESILKSLKTAMNKGNSQAKSELEEWELMYNEVRVTQHPKHISDGKDSGILDLKRNN